MAIKIYWLHEFSNLARLGIMARPRGEDWLEDEIIGLRRQDVQVMVSLLEQDEIAEYCYPLPHGYRAFIDHSRLSII